MYVDESAVQDTTSTAVANLGAASQNMLTIPTAPAANGVVSPVQSSAGTPAPGMNPPHGQPGHRCDIPVGAPLSSAPANAAQQTLAPVQNIRAEQISAPAKTAPGTNPPHGQPGHRCDIAVGAPLNSAPSKPAVTSDPQTQPLPANVAAPQNAESPALASGTKPATNPEHGQPFHRCDLAVGAALP